MGIKHHQYCNSQLLFSEDGTRIPKQGKALPIDRQAKAQHSNYIKMTDDNLIFFQH